MPCETHRIDVLGPDGSLVKQHHFSLFHKGEIVEIHEISGDTAFRPASYPSKDANRKLRQLLNIRAAALAQHGQAEIVLHAPSPHALKA